MPAAAGNSFVRELNPHGEHIYIYIYIEREREGEGEGERQRDRESCVLWV